MPNLPQVLLTSTGNVLEVTGDKLAGDGYYGHSDGLHTVAWVLNKFKGRIKVQATLAIDPVESDWCDIDLDNSGAGYVDFTTAVTGTQNYNFTGNWVWVRAKVIRSHDPNLTILNSGVVSHVWYNY
jgi:hypothetical protein